MTAPFAASRARVSDLRERAGLLEARIAVAESFARSLAAIRVPSAPKEERHESLAWEWFRSRRATDDRMWLRVEFDDDDDGAALRWRKTSTDHYGRDESGTLPAPVDGRIALPPRFVELARGIACGVGDFTACSRPTEVRP